MIISQFLHTKLPHYLFLHLKNPQVKWKNSSNLLNGVLALCLWKAKQRSFLLLHYPPPDATRSLSYSTRSLSYSTVLLHCPTPLSYSRCHQITVLDTNSRRLSGLVLPWSALMDTSIFLRGCSSLSPRTEPLYKHPNVPAK